MCYLATRNSLHYRHKNSFGDLSKVMASPLAPSITIIAPAYNEGLTIVENIRSLLSLRYVDYEVMVVNDGSKDDTLEKIIEAYDLVQIEQEIDPDWRCKPIRGIYKSKHRSFSKLTVIDKENGGKSDALNTGIHLSTSRYVGCIDVDCLLLPDALLHVVKSFYQRSGKRVIGCWRSHQGGEFVYNSRWGIGRNQVAQKLVGKIPAIGIYTVFFIGPHGLGSNR